MWHQKARPRRRPAAKASRARALVLAGPAGGEPQRPRAEREHLDVVAVVAEAVAGEEGRAEGGVEPREEGRPRPGHEEGQAEEPRDVGQVEEHRDEGEGPCRVHDEREGGRQVRLQAPAVGHLRNEHEPLAAVRHVQGHDAGQRPVGRHRRRRPADHHGQAEEEGERQHQQEGGRGRAERRGGERAPAAPQPGEPGEERGGQDGQGRQRAEGGRAPRRRHVEPQDAEDDPQHRGGATGQGGRVGPPSAGPGRRARGFRHGHAEASTGPSGARPRGRPGG